LEEIKTAASYALGSLTVGNLEKYLPYLLSEIQHDTAKRQYLLLHALKEVIGSESENAPQLSPVFRREVDGIWKVLCSHCDAQEDGIRTIVAECLGKLCLVEVSGWEG